MLERALVADAGTRGISLTVAGACSTRWASATFTGARHVLTIAGEAPAHDAVAAWLDSLPDVEFALYGHLVADIAVAHQAREGATFTATIEALTLDER